MPAFLHNILSPRTHIDHISFGEECFYAKREDQILDGLGANKLRKASSLFPSLLAGRAGVVLVGGAYSNQLLAYTRLLRQHAPRIDIRLVVRGEPELRPVGNLAQLRALLPPQAFHWQARSSWNQAPHAARQLAEQLGSYAVIPEGSFMPQAVAGAATLAQDIQRNEAESGLHFGHIWLDAGTGLTAMATLLALPDRHYHMIELAADPLPFAQRLAQVAHWMGQDVPALHYSLYRPGLAPRFGQVTQAVRDYAARFRAETGIQPDWVYTTKLLATALPLLNTQAGTQLLVLSGGGA